MKQLPYWVRVFRENACIFLQFHENARIFLHFRENVRIFLHFQENARIFCISCKLDENAHIFSEDAHILCKLVENARILCKLGENACILLKMCAFSKFEHFEV